MRLRRRTLHTCTCGQPHRSIGAASSSDGQSTTAFARSAADASSSLHSDETRSTIDAVTEWFARPVLHVSSVEASLRFYVDRFGFIESWRYDEDGGVRVAQVERAGCALILSDQWPEKAGKSLIFVSLNVEPERHADEVAAVDALRAELEARNAPVTDGRWGYRLLVVEDPDGNQLFFPYPKEPPFGC